MAYPWGTDAWTDHANEKGQIPEDYLQEHFYPQERRLSRETGCSDCYEQGRHEQEKAKAKGKGQEIR